MTLIARRDEARSLGNRNVAVFQPVGKFNGFELSADFSGSIQKGHGNHQPGLLSVAASRRNRTVLDSGTCECKTPLN